MNYYNFNFLETNKQVYATSTEMGVHYIATLIIYVNVGYGNTGGILHTTTQVDRTNYPGVALMSIYEVHMLNTYKAWMDLL